MTQATVYRWDRDHRTFTPYTLDLPADVTNGWMPRGNTQNMAHQSWVDLFGRPLTDPYTERLGDGSEGLAVIHWGDRSVSVITLACNVDIAHFQREFPGDVAVGRDGLGCTFTSEGVPAA